MRSHLGRSEGSLGKKEVKNSRNAHARAYEVGHDGVCIGHSITSQNSPNAGFFFFHTLMKLSPPAIAD
jgi:hypothetical protein